MNASGEQSATSALHTAGYEQLNVLVIFEKEGRA
jgi:hypothetical protein